MMITSLLALSDAAAMFQDKDALKFAVGFAVALCALWKSFGSFDKK